MKFIVNLLVIAAAGFLGYALEPNLRLELTGISHLPPQPKPQPGNQEEQILSKIDVRAYDFDQLPQQVTLKKSAEVTDSASGTKMTIPSGTKVKLVRLGTGTLVISPGIPTVEGEVDVQDTDIREQLSTNPPPAVVAKKPEEKPADAMAGNEPADAMTGEKPPGETPANEPGMDGPAPGSNPALKPVEGEPAPAAPAEFAPLAQDEIVKIMQDSIRGGQVTSFKIEDVSEWTAGEPEELNGVKFNVGMVTYTGTTFMGKSQLRGKAYISGGKVHNWINPKSGTDLK